MSTKIRLNDFTNSENLKNRAISRIIHPIVSQNCQETPTESSMLITDPETEYSKVTSSPTSTKLSQGGTPSIDCGSFGFLSLGIPRPPRAAPRCNLTPLPWSGVHTFPSLLAQPPSLPRPEQSSLSVFPASHPRLEEPMYHGAYQR